MPDDLRKQLTTGGMDVEKAAQLSGLMLPEEA